MSTITLEASKLGSIQNSFPPVHAKMITMGCPACRANAGPLNPNEALGVLTCSSCGFVMRRRRGIWQALLPSREIKFQQFIKEYQAVRLKEGRGAGGVHYFLSLPYKDISGQNSWQWNIRGRSFRYFTRRILSTLEKKYPHGMDILDVGAGNCWMSYRLAQRGHWPVAVDLFENEQDGLGAARHYHAFIRRRFPRFLAEMDRLPFAESQFDLVVFNASCHYSEDYEITLGEALRCLRRPGHILIMDSPFYYTEASGIAMVREKHARFQEKFGLRSDSIASREFLTGSLIEDLGRRIGIRWELHRPWLGLSWAVRPLRARLLGRREPAKFFVAWGTV